MMRRSLTVILGLALAACHAAPPADHAAANEAAPAAALPDPGSAEAAVDVVRRYYAAIAARDYAAAYRQWGDDGRASGQDLAGFTQGFARTRTVQLLPGPPGEAEGAAGSIFVTVPVTVEAVLDDGTHQHFTGSYVLRRVNDVPGATAAQRRWHIHSADMRADQAG